MTLEVRSYLARVGYIQLTGKSLGTADVVLQNDPALRDVPGVFWRESSGGLTNEAGQHYRFGCPGLPDLWLIRRSLNGDGRPVGELIGIEIKAARGRLSPQQQTISRIMGHCGIAYIVVASASALARAGL